MDKDNLAPLEVLHELIPTSRDGLPTASEYTTGAAYLMEAGKLITAGRRSGAC